MTPDVSLVMPVWRPRADWLRTAVDSALAERDADVELIVVDDGSPEGVDELLRGDRDPSLRTLRIRHAGAAGARDAGIAAARGRYVRFLDCDDEVVANSSSRLLELVEGDPGHAAYGATLECDEDLTPRREVTDRIEGCAAEACVLGGFDVYVVSILFPCEAVDRAGTWAEAPFRVNEDWDFVRRCLEHAPVRRLDEVVTRYRRHAASLTGTAAVGDGAAAGRVARAADGGRWDCAGAARVARRIADGRARRAVRRIVRGNAEPGRR